MGCGCRRNQRQRRNVQMARPRTTAATGNNNRRANLAAKKAFQGIVSAATTRQRKRIEKLRRETIKSKFGK
jgi:hypothetical protein